jgi:hypothetical protein
MSFKSSNAMLVVLIALVSVAFLGLVYSILGSGRSLGAYVIGVFGMLGCIGLVLVTFAAVGWVIDWFDRRLEK